MKQMKLYFLFLLLPVLFLYTGCSKDDSNPNTPPAVNESELVAQYLEANGDFVNTTAPAMITAEAVRTNQSSADQVILDIRSQADFETKGHIEGAVRVDFANLLTYYKTNNLQNKQTVVVACYSGQTAGYAVGLLRLLGYTNVFDLKWGMSSWNQDVANSWSPSVGNSHATDFVTTVTAKYTAGSLPTINTGKTAGKDILEARVAELFTAGFDAVKITNATVYTGLANYYIVNYWAQNHYDIGHIAGAVQYTPKVDFKLSTNLKTLPTNKPIVVYCYTGQTSSQVAAYLKVLGYDAKTLLFGANAMIYDIMGANGMTTFKDTEIKGYDYVTGP